MTPITSHTRRLGVAALCAIALLMTTAPAGAQSTKDQLDAAREETTRIRSEFERIAQAFAEADMAQHRTEEKMEQTEAEVARAKSDIAELQNSLKDRIRTAYRMRGIGFFQFLLEARSFRDFNLRLMSLQRQTLADEDVLLQLRRKRAELQLKERQLAVENGVFERRRADYEKQAAHVSITLQQANSLVARLKNRYTREQIAKLFSISRVTGGRIVQIQSCPVDPPHVVTNSFGAPRGGGTRRHQGNDIMADMGIPLRAVNDGTVTRVSNHGLGGLAFYLWDGSTEYYYAHLSKVAVSAGQHVSAGQLVGNNGDSGNAKGGAPHLHFEIHPGGGSAIDPYPSLSTVC
jgi:murein DD-endopeptidase MepM/ murein hydrolase activator NlpD